MDEYIKYLNANTYAYLNNIIINKLFNVNLPCIYLINIFADINMTKELQINNNDIVAIFGSTSKGFIQNINIENTELLFFALIDPLHISQAENELKKLLANNVIKYKKHSEIIVLNKDYLNLLKESYEKLAIKYSGHSESFRKESVRLENEIRNMKINHENEIQLLKADFKNKELETKLNFMEQQKQSEIANSVLATKLKEAEILAKEAEIRTKEAEMRTKEAAMALEIANLKNKIKQNTKK